MDYKYLDISSTNSVTTVTINRPDALNALNSQVLKELREAFSEIDADNACKAVILTGAGRSFVAGADIGEMAELTPVEAAAFGKLGTDTFLLVERLSKPVIAAVNGFALGGGCELACACDIRIASVKAKFGQPEVGLGITPGFGGTQRLQRIVGQAKAAELIFTAETINAEEAARIGLVSYVYEPDGLMAKATELAEKIASKSRTAVTNAKAAIIRGANTDLSVGMAIERDAFALCFAANDQKEGMNAFLNKRAPEFTD